MPTSILTNLPATIYAAFRGKLLTGTLWRSVVAASGGLTDQGDPIDLGAAQWPCQGFIEGYNEVYRQRAGIPSVDSRLNIFAASLPSGVRPLKDDRVFMQGQWWQLRKDGTDPAQALWVCQSFVCPAPGVSS